MKLIKQPENSTQCGQCVVAMLANVPICEVLKLMGTGKTYPAKLRKALKEFGVYVGRHSRPIVDGAGPSGHKAAVFLDLRHWIAWDGEEFLDPKFGKFKNLTEHYGPKARAYIEYEPPYFVVIMPVNERGEGPEMDNSKVRKIIYEVWNGMHETVSEHDTQQDAYLEARRLNAEAL